MNQFNDILTEHEKIIFHVIRKLNIRDGQKEFYQEGVIALWRAWETYDVRRGKFSSYAYFLIEKALLSLIRKQNKRIEKEQVYIQTIANDNDAITAAVEESFDPYVLNKIKRTLSPNQWKWFTLFILQDLSIKTIAEKEQTTIDAVKNWGRHARTKLKRMFERDELSFFSNR